MIKQEVVQVPREWGVECRDIGKTFLITEMPAAQAEKWAWRLFLALKGTGGSVPLEVVERMGMVGVGICGLNAILAAPVKFEEIEPLLDEMIKCVQVIRDPRRPEIVTPLMEGDIEEVRTIGWLRSEVLRLHTGFSAADALSSLLEISRAPASMASPNMSTSPLQ